MTEDSSVWSALQQRGGVRSCGKESIGVCWRQVRIIVMLHGTLSPQNIQDGSAHTLGDKLRYLLCRSRRAGLSGRADRGAFGSALSLGCGLRT